MKALVDVEKLATEAVDCAVKLHIKLGPGLFESAYEALLAESLRRRGLFVERQKLVSIDVDGMRVADAFKVDLLVEHALVIELKSIERFAPVHLKQVLTYLRLLDLPLGLLMNFGVDRMTDGLKRVKNELSAFPSPSRLCENPTLSPPRANLR